MSSLRVLLVNDKVGGLQAADSRLAGDPSISVIGRANSGPEAFRKMQELKPDLVLMELTLPEDKSGVCPEYYADPESRRVVAMALNDTYFRVSAAGVEGGVVTKPFGDRALQLIARLFMMGADQTPLDALPCAEELPPQAEQKCA